MDNHLEEEPEENSRKIPKLVKLGIGVLLLAVFLIYIFPGDVIQVLEGRLESSQISNNQVNYSNGTITFEPKIYQSLKSMYLENPKTEIKICLKGEKNNGDYYITDWYQPIVDSQSVIHVSSERCDSNTLISLHTHPFKHCLFSEQDIKSHKLSREIYPSILTSVMCGPDRFNFLN